jgi:hypothetical protein
MENSSTSLSKDIEIRENIVFGTMPLICYSIYEKLVKEKRKAK